jgi:hypothetical protein
MSKENKFEEISAPCFVYYWKAKGKGRIQRIGYAESVLGDSVMIRESSYSRDLIKKENVEPFSDLIE